ncbi:hypothetical protein B0T26DRAFT_538177, partial [Lasiosphaeria miniovina]
PGGSSDIGKIESLNGHSLPRKDERPAEIGDTNDYLPLARSGSREGTLCSDEGGEGDEPELANTKLPLHLPDSQDWIDFRRDVGGHCITNLGEDYRTLVPGDRGKQREDGSVVLPQVQESQASMPRLSDSERNDTGEVANTEPSMQSSASQDRANLQNNIARRRSYDTGDEENCSPIMGSDAKQGKDEVTQPPRKRRSIRTSAPTTC